MGLNIGCFVKEDLPPIDFGRIAAQTAKQVIVQRVREAERERQYEEYKDRVGEIVNGSVKRNEFGNYIVDIGRAEAMLPRDSIIPRETFQNGDRVRAYISEVKQANRGAQIFLSRTCPQFMEKLFMQEVPEIYDSIIEIKAVARDPGSRAKIAVRTDDSSVDPVGACVGMRGSRVQAVVNELQGEKIDIVLWDESVVTFVVNSLTPAEIAKVVVDEELRKIEVVVPDESLSVAIGRRGQNVKLASMLTGWEIDILTEDEESEKRQTEFKMHSEAFMNGLDVDEMIAQLLAVEGFTKISEVANCPVAELESIEGFDADIASELIARAQAYIAENPEEELSEKKDAPEEVIQQISSITLLTSDMIEALKVKKVENIDDLADLSSEELIEHLSEFKISQEDAEKIIMQAREHWFVESEEQSNKEKASQ